MVVAYDAMQSGQRGTNRTTLKGEVDVVYCGEEEADNWLMREASMLHTQRQCDVFVVTSDAECRNTIVAGGHTSALLKCNHLIGLVQGAPCAAGVEAGSWISLCGGALLPAQWNPPADTCAAVDAIRTDGCHRRLHAVG